MRDQLIQYIDLLFAGAAGAEDIRQEILQNTLDRYDDLLSQGKSPQAAYRLAISGIGDIHEILGSIPKENKEPSRSASSDEPEQEDKARRILKAVAIAFFILSLAPILILENSIGVCLCLAMVAAGVGLLTVYGKPSEKETPSSPASSTQNQNRSPINRGITGGIWATGLCAYFLISFSTHDWHITWILFPILGCLCGFVDACFDLSKKPVGALIRMVLFFLLTGILVSVCIGITLGGKILEGSFLVSPGIQGEYQTSEGTVPAGEIRDLQIEWVAGSITVQAAQTDTISFTENYYGAEPKPMIWKQSGDKLIIQYCEPYISIGFFQTTVYTKDLVITVPEDWICDALSIDSVSAKIQVSGLNSSSIDLDNVSGDCIFEACSTVDFDLETVSGEVDFQGVMENLDCDSVSANCEIRLQNEPKSIDMDGVSCDLILYLPHNCGFTVSLDSASGDFESDFPFSMKNGNYIHADGSCKIHMDSASGDIRIQKIKE